jgi:hypothetical protein
MLMPFLQYVSEARVIRRQNDLQRYTFQDIQERVYVSFLALSLLKNNEATRSWAKGYADQTMAYGAFDIVRGSANDLHNLLAVLDGRKDILQKLKNKRDAEVSRQRSPFPTLFAKRYLRKLTDDYSFLYRLERELRIHNNRYRQIRRAIADWHKQSVTNKKKVLRDLTAVLLDLMPNSDLYKKIKAL